MGVEQFVDVEQLQRPTGYVDEIEIPVHGMPPAVLVGTREAPDVEIEPLARPVPLDEVEDAGP